jgi:hypothetical protein
MDLTGLNSEVFVITLVLALVTGLIGVFSCTEAYGAVREVREHWGRLPLAKWGAPRRRLVGLNALLALILTTVPGIFLWGSIPPDGEVLAVGWCVFGLGALVSIGLPFCPEGRRKRRLRILRHAVSLLLAIGSLAMASLAWNWSWSEVVKMF